MMKDEDYMKMALDEARKALAGYEVPVGAVLVANGHILAKANNNPIAGSDPSAHAEMLVIRRACAEAGNYSLTGARLYVTLEPCVMCAGVILQARLAKVIFGARDPKAGAVVSLYQILHDSRLNHRVEVTEGILQEECAQILSGFFKEKRIKTPR